MNTYVCKERIWKRVTSLCMFLLFGTAVIFAQQGFTVTGTISDRTGETLPGVNIMVKGTTTGIASDINGKYSLSVPNQNAVLVFSYIGFENQEVQVSGRNVINITLQDAAAAIEEVVVMGYTSRRRSQVSGSVAQVSSEQLNDIKTSDINTMLQGKIGGVVVERPSANPNAQTNIVIRGNSSLSGRAEPLTVVDGIVGGTANPSDIKSISVLKDAAATGLYGARAANGVIVIETHSGSRTGKTEVTFSANGIAGFKDMGNFELMKSRDLYEFHRSFMDPAQFAQIRPQSLMDNNPETDWMSLAYRNSFSQDYVLSVTGGNDKTQIYISGNYYYEDGLQKYNSNEIVNFRVNVSHRITDNLKVDARVNARMRNFENEASGLYGSSEASRYIPWDSPYLADGKTIKEGYYEQGWTYRYETNFLHGWQYNFDEGRNHNLAGDFILTWNILPNLTFSSHNRGESINQKRVLYYDVRSTAGAGTGGELRNYFMFDRTLTSSNRLNYSLNFDKHALDLLAVQEYQEIHRENNVQVGTGFAPGIHMMEAAANIIKVAPSSGGSSTNASDAGNANDYKFLKMLVQADYSYNNKYFLVASYIREGSSRFGKNKPFANFFTVAGSWILTNEDFMKSQNIFDVLKVRLSYGLIGSADIGNYDALALYSLSGAFNGSASAVASQMGNANLTWEKIGTTNFGLDMSFFKSRLNLTVDLYDKRSRDLLHNVAIPPTSGFTQQRQNVGSMRNYGAEITINSVNVQTKDFRWDTDFNITFNKNKILSLYNGEEVQSTDFRFKEGQDRYIWYFRKWVGVDPTNGDPQWERIDPNTGEVSIVNTYNNATLQWIHGKSAAPKFNGGIGNEFSYKNISLRFMFNYSYGSWIHDRWATQPSDGQEIAYNLRKLQKGEVRWEKPGDIANSPKPVQGGNKGSDQLSSRALVKGDYLRLRNVTLRYSLPRDILSKVMISRATVFVSLENIWTLTDYPGIDVTQTDILGSARGERGSNMRNSDYPSSKRVSFGLNFTF